MPSPGVAAVDRACQARRQAAALFPVDSQHSTLDRVEAGMPLPLDRGAAGRVILAFDGERSETFDRICENCIATSFGERDPDCAGMAWALFEPNRKSAGAVALRTRAAFQQGEYQDHVFAVAEGGCSDAITWGPRRADGRASDAFADRRSCCRDATISRDQKMSRSGWKRNLRASRV